MPRGNGITRQEIMTCIKVNGGNTAEELAQELGISQVAVRQHLAALDAEGMIAVNIERKGLGRPTHRYRLTASGDETFPRDYAAFTASLLEELHTSQGKEAVKDLLALRRERIHNMLKPQLQGKSLPSRLSELVRIDNASGYMAETCAEGAGTHFLIRRNCALCAVARSFPGICCQGDAPLLESLLEDVRVECTASISRGDVACKLRITRNTPQFDG